MHNISFSGEVLREKDRCPDCKGKKVINETKILEVHVDKGMRDGQKIPFRGEGDQQVGSLRMNTFRIVSINFNIQHFFKLVIS